MLYKNEETIRFVGNPFANTITAKSIYCKNMKFETNLGMPYHKTAKY